MKNPNYDMVQSLFLQALGGASMCWEPRPSTEVFKPDEAKGIADEMLPKIVTLIEEGLIHAVPTDARTPQS